MRFEIPERKKLTYEMVIPIRWGDMDAMGHVNNTVYFRYLESLRIEWFRSIDCQPDPDGIGPVIINAFCSFIRQLEYPGEVLARHYAGEIGRSTIDTFATLERTDQPGVVYASGGATVVWTDFKAQKSVPVPDEVRALLA
ncbi:acyl-CoA thioesterase [Aquincola sp. S2]|uniref:Acyl-CoA thioesterase n=1 Tax=Pseudaquabacterium terrae TaxID=2732868 RepID=A0ABX2EN37_9BURK|nr:thioesterase family protein [Aquabacterium terrae]NRF69982.1 acyl-CoA thioesterase [Aquabacterium terrae]